MDNTAASGSKGPSRRLFLSASAVAAAAVPLVSQATAASAASEGTSSVPHNPAPDPALLALLGQIDPTRIQATIQQLVSFGTRQTQSSQTDPNRGIGAAYAWVFQQMQAIAATSNGNMTAQQQTFIQPAVPGVITAPTSITNTI